MQKEYPISPKSEHILSEAQLPPHILLGRTGENIASFILEKEGYKIIAKNWRKKHLELDLVCTLENPDHFQDKIIFIEVKTRRTKDWGGPLASFTQAKKLNLCKAAFLWLEENNAWHKSCQFDIICLIINPREINSSLPRDLTKNFVLEHYQNVIDVFQTLDNCHVYW